MPSLRSDSLGSRWLCQLSHLRAVCPHEEQEENSHSPEERPCQGHVSEPEFTTSDWPLVGAISGLANTRHWVPIPVTVQ